MKIFSRPYNKGFTLIQISILLTILAVAMVAALPSYQVTNNQNQVSTKKMQTVMAALRAYQAAYGTLPCPANPTLATSATYYGVAGTNNGTTNNCVGAPNANAAYALTTATNYIAVGMVPVRTLGLPVDAALDGYGRDITYMVDTAATATPWTSTTLKGSIPIMENAVYVSGTTWNGNLTNSVFALISHGADGYGAWLPEQTGTAGRLNTGSATEREQADNAQVNEANATITNNSGAFVNYLFNNVATQRTSTNTFDDIIVYKSNSTPSLNTLPISVAQNVADVTGSYNSTSKLLTLTVVFKVATAANITPSGSNYYPYLTILIGGNSVTTCQSTPCTGAAATPSCSANVCTFTYDNSTNAYTISAGNYTVQKTPLINANGGSISLTGTNVSAQYIPNVIDVTTTVSSLAFAGVSLGSGYIVSDTANKRVQYNTGGAGWNNIKTTYNNGTPYANITGVAYDAKVGDTNTYYVIDQGSGNTGSLIQCTAANNCGGASSVVNTGVTLSYPNGIAIDSNDGSCWVADTGNQRVLKCSTGCTSCSLAIGTAQTTNNFNPVGVVAAYVGSTHYVYISDATNNKIWSYTYTSAPTLPVTPTAFSSVSISGSPSSFSYPTGLAYNSNAVNYALWIADTQNNRVIKCHNITTTPPSSCTAYISLSGNSFNLPTGIGAASNNTYIANSGNNTIISAASDGSSATLVSTGAKSDVGNTLDKGYFNFNGFAPAR